MDIEAALVFVAATDLSVVERLGMAGFDASDFDDPRHRKAYKFTVQHATDHHAPSGLAAVLTVCGLELDADLYSGLTSAFVVQEALKRKVYRRIADAITQASEKLHQNSPDEALELLRDFTSSEVGVTSGGIPSRLFSLGDTVKAAYLKVKDGYTGIPLPWPSMTDLTMGLWPATATYFVARPGVGKTQVATLIARDAWRSGKRVLIVSPEMSKSEIVMRLLSAEAKIKLTDMRSGRMSDDDWTRLARRMSEISEAPLYIDDSPNLTMMEIRAKARRLKQKSDLKLIVIDYLQLMTSGKKVESRQQEVSEFSRQLKLLAKELEVPVVAMSQLNRGPEQRTDKKPMLSDLRESGAIEQDADMVILLHRPDAFERDDPRGGEADLILAKHRNGPTKTVTVAHQLHLSRFTNMARQ
jgi:replicative DNA helicase